MKNQFKVSYYNPCIETMNREDLMKIQFRKLKYQLEYLYNNNQFFRDRFDKYKVKPEGIKNMDDFREKIPSMDKSDIMRDQEENPPYGKRLGIPKEKIILTHLTSGTSGKGREAYGLTHSDLEYGGHCWAYGLHWIGVRKGETTVGMFPMATFAGGTTSYEAFRQMGVNNFNIAVLYDTPGVLDIIKRFKANHVLATPAYLMRMTAVAKELGYDIKNDFSSLESIWVVTENFPLQWGMDMEDIWDVTLHDGYGSTQQETLLGCTCEKGAVPDGNRGFMHVFEDYTIVEVLDREKREPVKSGEWGEVVITTLGREASPVVRYATSDRVMFLSHIECNCGRPFNGFQAGTISRYDDMLKIKGINIWPQATDEVIFTYNEIVEYNGKVIIGEGGKEEAMVLLEFKDNVSQSRKAELLNIISRELHDKTGIRIKAVVAEEGVKHFEFKPKRWEDEREKGLDVRRL